METTAKKCKQSFCTSWKDKCLWLKYDGDCMYCMYCLEANKTNSYTVGCKNFRIIFVQLFMIMHLAMELTDNFTLHLQCSGHTLQLVINDDQGNYM